MTRGDTQYNWTSTFQHCEEWDAGRMLALGPVMFMLVNLGNVSGGVR